MAIIGLYDSFWEEINDLPIFNPKKNPKAKEACLWLEKLKEEGKLRQIDIINIKGLLDCAINYKPK